jgi:hypothetical protein
MGFSLRKWIVISAYVLLPLFCSCDKHPLGQLPEVQREKRLKASGEKEGAGAMDPASEESPARKGTPGEFFPATKP